MSMTKWAPLLRRGGMSPPTLSIWESLQTAIANHQTLLTDNGIGREVDERDRVRVNARRVGLEAPLFADEAAETFGAVLNRALRPRDATERRDEQVEDSSTAQATAGGR